MVVSATNTSVDVLSGKLTPGNNLFANYNSIIEDYDLWGSMLNSFYFATVQTLLSLLICSLAGYGFEIYHDKHKDRLMAVLLMSMMVPFASTMIPLFQMVSKMGMLNSAAGFILPYLSTPLLIMLFRQSARAFPHDIIEAARIDGLNEFSIFFKMFIPTMRSTYAAAMTITFMSAWNSYLWPKVVLI
ncbi:MAG: carbohydrate ABC transporter permease, partial [Christensenellaceae bacterium]|nr:carbohydrate ABC transporter permease [Christensenellaceae bacterium]